MDEVRVLAHHTRSQGSTCWAIQHSILQQILQGDPLNYLLNVLLRPHCKYWLYVHLQPVIRPAPVAPTKTPAPAEPFRLPVPLLRLALYENALTSFMPLIVETARSCDHVLAGVGGTLDSANTFITAYTSHLRTAGGELHPQMALEIDVESFAAANPESYAVKACPLPAVGGPTLLSTRPWMQTDQDLPGPTQSAAKDERVESGADVAEVQHLTCNQLSMNIGPFSDLDNCYAVDHWAAWE
ncbi:hypothetical protein BDW71DRAFT_201918 [Aspergillus fruticulosus]